MSEQIKSTTVIVKNAQGLHMRPAFLIAETAKQFDSKIEMIKDDVRIDGKSALDILTLGASQGTEVALEATGPDASNAIETLQSLFASGFPKKEETGNPQ